MTCSVIYYVVMQRKLNIIIDLIDFSNRPLLFFMSNFLSLSKLRGCCRTLLVKGVKVIINCLRRRKRFYINISRSFGFCFSPSSFDLSGSKYSEIDQALPYSNSKLDLRCFKTISFSWKTSVGSSNPSPKFYELNKSPYPDIIRMQRFENGY